MKMMNVEVKSFLNKYLQISILHSINIENREGICVDQRIQCKNHVDLESGHQGTTAKTKNLKN